MRAFLPLFSLLKRSAKAVVGLPRFLKGMFTTIYGISSEFVLTLVVFVFIAAISILLPKILFLPIGALVALSVATILSLFVSIRFRGNISTQAGEAAKTQDLENEITELRSRAQQAEDDKARMQVQVRTMTEERTRIANISGLFEVNLLAVELAESPSFDFYLPRGKRAERQEFSEWAASEELPRVGDKRVFGSFQLSYESAVGIDLKQVLVRTHGSTAEYYLPPPTQTGVRDQRIANTRELVAICKARGITRTASWEIDSVEQDGTETAIASAMAAELMEETSSTDENRTNRLPEGIERMVCDAAHARVEILFRMCGLKPIRVNSPEDLKEAVPLPTFLSEILSPPLDQAAPSSQLPAATSSAPTDVLDHSI